MSHPTFAFSERQIHSVLKVINDESVAVSVRTMRSLITEAIKAGALLHGKMPGTSRRRTGFPQSLPESSVDGPGLRGNVTDKSRILQQ